MGNAGDRQGRRRLLHLIDTGGPGGAETMFLRLAAGLETRGWDAIPVVSREGWLAAQLRDHGLEPVILPPGTGGRLAYLGRILRLARGERVSAILAHLLGAGFYASLAGRLAGLPVVTVLHGQKDIEGSRLLRLRGRVLALPRGRTVFVSGALRGALQPVLGLSDGRCAVIHNGVDIARFGQPASGRLRAALGLAPGQLLIGAVGNLRPPKAYDVLLEAAAEVARRHPGAYFVVAGEGRPPLLDELEALRDRLGLQDRFRFLGLVEDIPGLLAELDLFVLSSSREGFSIACVEAMAAGRPVVATRSGGPEEIVEDGVSGRLVGPGNAEALAGAILELVADPELRSRLARAGRRRAEQRFSFDGVLTAYGELLDAL